MKNSLVIIYFFLIPILILAQENLVINPSFEEYSDLPTHFSNNGKSFCLGWTIPNESSPDYFHYDCSSQYLSIAMRDMNFNDTHSGEGCMGLIPFSWNGYIEHITGSLINPLQKGQVYLVSFWIKCAGDVCLFTTDCLGALFTKEKFFLPYEPFYESIYNDKIYADVESKMNLFYVNDSAWVEINFFYKARGGEKYLTIGKFYKEKIKLQDIKYYRKPDVQFTNKKEKFIRKKKNQNVLLINKNFATEKKHTVTEAYYYIDDVSVTLIAKPN